MEFTQSDASNPGNKPPGKPFKKNRWSHILIIVLATLIIGVLGYYAIIYLTLQLAFKCGLRPCAYSTPQLEAFQKSTVNTLRSKAIAATNIQATSIDLGGGKLIASSHEDYCAEFDGGGNGDFSTHFKKDCSYVVMLYVAYTEDFKLVQPTLAPKLDAVLLTQSALSTIVANCAEADNAQGQIKARYTLSQFPPPQTQGCMLSLPLSNDPVTLAGIVAPLPIFTLKQTLTYADITNLAKPASPSSILSIALTNNYFSQALPPR